ncbi:MAG: helix-turn-helix domain-containing protein [Bacillota bacterium]|nr:helix-turn-helix domain-containing protein [Bacillota bacterium]
MFIGVKLVYFDIANKIGTKKSSIYNHFKSKEELVLKIYEVLRENALRKSSKEDMDMENYISENDARGILKYVVERYMEMNSENSIRNFYKVVVK